MSKDDFHATLRDYLHREPFAPFLVRLRDGRHIAIKQPPVVFCDGAASFIDLEETALVEFFHEDVEEFHLVEQETPA